MYQKNQLHFAQAHHAAAGYPQGYYPYAPYTPMTYSNGGGYMPPGAVPPPLPPGYLGNPGVVPTAKLVDLGGSGKKICDFKMLKKNSFFEWKANVDFKIIGILK